MKHQFRFLAVVLFALSAASGSTTVIFGQNPPPATDWKTGDLFVGVGRYNVHPGQYLATPTAPGRGRCSLTP